MSPCVFFPHKWSMKKSLYKWYARFSYFFQKRVTWYALKLFAVGWYVTFFLKNKIHMWLMSFVIDIEKSWMVSEKLLFCISGSLVLNRISLRFFGLDKAIFISWKLSLPWSVLLYMPLIGFLFMSLGWNSQWCFYGQYMRLQLAAWGVAVQFDCIVRGDVW